MTGTPLVKYPGCPAESWDTLTDIGLFQDVHPIGKVSVESWDTLTGIGLFQDAQ